MEPHALTKRLIGKVVSRVAEPARGSIAIHFADGALLQVQARGDGLTATLHEARAEVSRSAFDPRPTRRQREYLAFIQKYRDRYGIPPAEADIQRHFLVSAPSVNTMIQSLERRGFITRARDASGRTVPRSIEIVIEDL